LTGSARIGAEKGNKGMKEMLNAMEKINEASSDIAAHLKRMLNEFRLE
jgi:methyl-accepting chemotaxis protein